MRRPRHFESSWRYWHPERAGFAKATRAITMADFVADPGQYLDLIPETMRRFIYNGQAHDLGLTREALTPDRIGALIEEMDRKFVAVLITEHMAESLVMLKRRMCWDLEDVVFYSLKAHAKTPEPGGTLRHDTGRSIDDFNFADKLLYDHFNRSLWASIQRDDGFAPDLARFQVLQATFSARCSGWSGWSEDRHRKSILEVTSAGPEVACHLAMMDSASFSKFLKGRSGLPVTECRGQETPRQYVYLMCPGTEEHIMQSILTRFAENHGLKRAKPFKETLPGPGPLAGKASRGDGPSTVSAHAYGWPAPIARVHVDRFSMIHASVLVDGYATYSPALDSIIWSPSQVYKHIALLRNPVNQFLIGLERSALDPGTLPAGFAGKSIDDRVSALLSGFKGGIGVLRQLWPQLTAEQKGLLWNSQSTTLGLFQLSAVDSLPTVTALNRSALHTVWPGRKLVLLVADHLDESLVMLKRLVCWDLADIMFSNAELRAARSPVSQPGTAALSDATRGQIVAHNQADASLYNHANATLWEMIEDEVGFNAELAHFRQTRRRLDSFCNRSIRTAQAWNTAGTSSPGGRRFGVLSAAEAASLCIDVHGSN